MNGFSRFSFRSTARLVLSATIACAGGAQAARAALMGSDSFSGTAGQTLAGMNGGTGFSDAWHAGNLGPDDSASYVEQSRSLDSAIVPTSGGRVASLAQYSLGSGLTRDLATPMGTPGTTYYMSMLLRADGTLNEGASGGFFGVLLNASTTTPALSQDLFIGKTGSGSFGLEDRGGTNSHLSTTTAAIGVTDLLVVKAQFNASGADTFTLYVNPTATDMGTGVVKQDSYLGMVNSLSIYSTGAFSLDELRLGASLGDVIPAGETIAVPEPASVVMLSLGGLGLAVAARFRRTRRTVGA